jgi:hypothetical protein
MLLFSANKWLGLTWGIMALYGLVGAVGINPRRWQDTHRGF